MLERPLLRDRTMPASPNPSPLRRMPAGPAALLAACLAGQPAAGSAAPAAADPGIDWQRVGPLEVARTETTIGQFRRFVQATGRVTLAERAGGGQVFEAGWTRKDGWTWQRPFGGARPPADDEPAVHLGFDEARDFCRWAGGRLPTDAEWVSAAYAEQREAPPAPFQRGRSYPYPTGDQPTGAQCLADCGPAAAARALNHGARLMRGDGHARVGTTPPGVNGLYDMGGNVWEWVDEPPGATGTTERRTRGGSWWYGAAPMRADHLASKPADTTVVYIGFRCVRDTAR